MQAFWAELPAARLEGAVLRLPDGVFFLGDSKLGSRLYVRPVYGPLFEALLTEKSVNSKRLFVITGTAGIGKSFFLLYALWRFAVMAAPPPAIIFERFVDPHDRGLAYLCFRPRSPKLLPVCMGGRADFLMEELQDPRTW